MKKVYQSSSPQDTALLAKKIVPSLVSPAILCLTGDLGTGKTTFTQALARSIGVTDVVTSPTFTLLQPYTAQHKNFTLLVHCDAYRVLSGEEFLTTGLREYFTRPKTLIVIEWSEHIQDILPLDTWLITFTFGKKETERIITITPTP